MASVQDSDRQHDRSETRRQRLERFVAAAAVALLVSGWTGVGAAQVLPAYPTTSSPSATAWFPDRYPPSQFANAGAVHGRSDVLQLGVDALDGQTTRPPAFAAAFYNTQGRKVLAGGIAAPVSWIGSLYIPASWQIPSPSDGSGSRRSDLWATLWPASGGDTCAGAACDVFPIIGFSNAAVPDANNAVGGTPRLRVFDGANGGWVNLGTAVTYDAWTDFCVTFTGSAVEYRVGGQLAYTAGDLTQSDTGFGPVTQLNNIIVQAYNYGYTYDTAWSRLAAGSGACADLTALFDPPTPTATATLPPTDTATATETATATATPVATDTALATATATASSSATPPATATPTLTLTATPTATPPAMSPCPPFPRADCRAAAKSLLSWRKGAAATQDRLIWRWAKGAATTAAELADPTAGADYALCIYTGAPAGLLAAAVLPAGSQWRAAGSRGYRFTSPADSPGGMQTAGIKSGAAGRSRAFARGKGGQLPDPSLDSLPLPVTAQLLSPDGGVCFASVYDGAAVLRSDATRFKARVRP